jgi:hypothetical protein
MRNEEIVIDIDPQGNVTVEGKGFAGADCVKLTAALEEALGDVEERRLKPEYHQTRPASPKTVAR